MTIKNYLLFYFLSILIFYAKLHIAENITSEYNIASFNRSNFPADFLFGASTSAYQFEGAANADGKGQSMWDAFAHQNPDLIKDHTNADVAVDAYNRYKEDAQLMKNMGLTTYRFSISWPRILPNGSLSGGINQPGIDHYNNLINDLLANGIQPFVTLFHWDIPQALETAYGGFLSPLIVKDFVDYVNVCFKAFGDRVKYWQTLNEPLAFSIGYAGIFAPMRCSAWQNPNCKGGDSGTEPYIVAHHQILAHAAAVNLYKTQYQATQNGKIGITHVSRWTVPYSNSTEDIDAAQRSVDFDLGWFMDPVVNGDYPSIMKSLVGNRLPKFTADESKMIKGSFDFIGLNYYSAFYAKDASGSITNSSRTSVLTDSQVNLTDARDGIPIGPKSAAGTLTLYPKGLLDFLLYIKSKYGNPLIYITENGYDEMNNPSLTLEQALADEGRLDMIYQHLFYLQKATEEGVNVKGYIVWSLLDGIEWKSGFTRRFGLIFVDYNDGLNRHPKLSANWFQNFLAANITAS